MNARAVLLVLSCFAFSAARADDAVFAMQAWQSPSGLGLVRTVGPMSAERCARGISKLPRVDADVPPDMQLALQVCAPPLQLQAYVAAFHCVAAQKRATKLPDVQLWLYTCAGPL